MKIVFIAHQCFSCCRTLLSQSRGIFCFSYCPASEEAGGAIEAERGQPAQLIQADQRDVQYHYVSAINIEGKK